YRASDGQHIGVFDPATGKQISGPVNGNIKKYL
ncbi:MAG TPA: cytotoxic family protein, partial [Erwinia persicina]|nr:cytotoxic family protein [Erwinia persicina]